MSATHRPERRRSLRRFGGVIGGLCAVALVAFVALVLAPSGSEGAEGDPVEARLAQHRSDLSLEGARGFQSLPLYWLGPEFEGLPLMAITRYQRGPIAGEPRATDLVSFIYGECKPVAGQDSCAPPLTVQVSPLCLRNPSLYRPDLPMASRTIRGVPARIIGEEGALLELYTKDAAIAIFGERALGLRAAAAAAKVNAAGAPVGPGGELPPPAADVLAGRAGC